jgi:glycosyltransferase involved in cell wall biosynthesis
LKISFATLPGNLRTDNGYGYAGWNMIKSLQELGHEVPYSNPSAPVQVYFSQPTWYQFYKGQYKIGYTPWESSALPDGWLEPMNDLDELWTPSDQCKTWFTNAGVEVPIHVYPHGINHIFAPKLRKRRDKLRFLHIGEPAPRKGGQLAFDAFREAFGDRDDVHLTLKCYMRDNTIRNFSPWGELMGTPDELNNVSVDDRMLETEELVQLYHDHDVLVYPSWGEGFGLIPLEAAATGMTVLSTAPWAQYKRYIKEIPSREADSPWPHIHPGKMYEPLKEPLVDLLLDTYDNFDQYNIDSHYNSALIHEEYDWLRVTEDAFAHIVKKFS